MDFMKNRHLAIYMVMVLTMGVISHRGKNEKDQ